jgi:hypothetical protein
MPGQVGKTSSPAGTAEKKRLFQASLRDWLRYRQTPAFKTPGCFSRRGGIPSGHSVFGCPKIEMRPFVQTEKTIATACLFDILAGHFAGNGGGKTALISALV